jgi:hypothetical protein
VLAFVGVAVGIRGVLLAVGLGVFVRVLVDVAVGAVVAVFVGNGVAVCVGVAVAVAVGTGVGVGAAVQALSVKDRITRMKNNSRDDLFIFISIRQV